MSDTVKTVYMFDKNKHSRQEVEHYSLSAILKEHDNSMSLKELESKFNRKLNGGYKMPIMNYWYRIV